ncbi:MAG: 30S ribosomal protein S17 [Chloroflexi bacterium]|nr:30S ribosomal protein S17 [Chloroflexota bacterium]
MADRKVVSKVGRVVSDKMNKTIVVRVEVLRRHALYRKIVRGTRKFKAHDEQEVAKKGDVVRIVEARPYSKEKRWRVAEIVKKGEELE